MAPMPYLTADLPGIGGTLRATPEDFEVEELPAYPPSGSGDHVFAWIEKRALTTVAAIEAMARALGVGARDIGAAGMKDRHAVTRQWLSLPPPTTPEQVAAVEIEGLRVLTVQRHNHKLRTGHLRGNRFRLVVRGLADPAAAAVTAAAGLTQLGVAPGAANWFGEQRFGREGDNAARGRAMVLGERVSAPTKIKRLLVSAFQSELFNDWLERRITEGVYRTVLHGDVLQKRESGGIFTSIDPSVDQPRLEAGEVVITGPMFGHRMRGAGDGSPAAAREAEVLVAAGIAAGDFERVGSLGEGTRRAAAIEVAEPSVAASGPDAITVCFRLPAGAYATIVMRELMKD